jgi:hypothetical protein
MSNVLSECLPAGGIGEIHRRFSELLPEQLLAVSDPESRRTVRVAAGELRHDDVKVGRHLAISPGAVPRFMARFEQAYSVLGRSETILAGAGAHHRLLWIHPFADGNGRVARLMSHASLLEVLDTGSVRGSARRVHQLRPAALSRPGEVHGAASTARSPA